MEVKALKGQTIYDIATQHTGTQASAVFILKDNPHLEGMNDMEGAAGRFDMGKPIKEGTPIDIDESLIAATLKRQIMQEVISL